MKIPLSEFVESGLGMLKTFRVRSLCPIWRFGLYVDEPDFYYASFRRVVGERCRPYLLGHFHLIISGNQKTEFRNPRLNSRPLLPFNQPGFDRIGGAVKNNGSHQQVL